MIQHSVLPLVRLLLTPLLCVAACTSTVAAQLTVLSQACPPLGPYTSTYLSVGSITAGTSSLVSQATCYSWGGSTYWHVLSVGFSDPAFVLPSCGCAIHAAHDIVFVHQPSPSLVGQPCLFLLNTQTALQLPAGTTGLSFYLQGTALAVAGPSGSPLCNEIGAHFFLTQALEVQIQ